MSCHFHSACSHCLEESGEKYSEKKTPVISFELSFSALNPHVVCRCRKSSTELKPQPQKKSAESVKKDRSGIWESLCFLLIVLFTLIVANYQEPFCHWHVEFKVFSYVLLASRLSSFAGKTQWKAKYLRNTQMTPRKKGWQATSLANCMSYWMWGF